MARKKKKSGLNLTGSVTRTRPESPRIMLVALTANRLEDKSLDVSTKDCLDGGHGVGKDHPNLLFSDCRGKSAHLVPEEKMVLKVQRVEVVPMVILVPWGPLGKRFVLTILDYA